MIQQPNILDEHAAHKMAVRIVVSDETTHDPVERFIPLSELLKPVEDVEECKVLEGAA